MLEHVETGPAGPAPSVLVVRCGPGGMAATRAVSWAQSRRPRSHSATFAAIAGSAFLRDTFAALEAGSGDSHGHAAGDGVVLNGRSTYVEFRRPGSGASATWTSRLAFGTDHQDRGIACHAGRAAQSLSRRRMARAGSVNRDCVRWPGRTPIRRAGARCGARHNGLYDARGDDEVRAKRTNADFREKHPPHFEQRLGDLGVRPATTLSRRGPIALGTLPCSPLAHFCR